MKNILTLKEKSILNNGLIGVIFIIMGILQLFKINPILELIVGVIAVIGLFLSSIPFFIKTESEDEMAGYNKNRARATIYTILLIALSIYVLVSTHTNQWTINLKIISPFLLGGFNLSECILFCIYEKVGD
ncbi:hypothetical protein [Clostridium botulinum]|uniref:hypothetical protein n=1 Tax=Clostridium botulinum TaxID=1491 RepID=UPI0013CDCEEB|nr:hypothetical protein [Clostridium botulinum]